MLTELARRRIACNIESFNGWGWGAACSAAFEACDMVGLLNSRREQCRTGITPMLCILGSPP
ncbi:hypothetical protein GCM10023333_17380 [Ferrimonas pelagia]|uniref:Uncharacterized protein n=1 Tax=Ferrimonas pelagia TaxID=1177826 RepID=A0ABP9ENJ0_9GAMM